jgi:broad specificity phosphatase PhoE
VIVIANEPEAVLVLVRHGEIVRPKDTSNFDRAPLSSEGWRQVNRLTTEWPVAKPSAVYSSDFLRAVQSATILQTAFHVPLEKRACLREWTADPADLPQSVYMDLERRAWGDFEWVPPGGESLAMAGDRVMRCLNEIAGRHHGDTVAVVGHGTLFSQFTSTLKGERPTEAYKNSIPFAGVAIVAHGDTWRLVSDFSPFAPSPHENL